MTGIELIEKLQENSQTLLMPVIVCTGIMQRSEDLCFALEKGAIDFLRKPIEPIELLARINSQIRFAETYKQLTAEREERAIFEKNQIEEKLIQQETELSDRLLLIAKYNEILKNTAELLKKMPTCVNKNICKPHIEGIINNINSLSFNEKWEEFYITFDKLYSSFFTKMVERYPNLTKNELKLCALLKLNLSTKEISTITQQSIRAVEMSRFRLRTKMGLDKNDTINNVLQ
jgi:FixJ family two-component response regulator